MTEDEAKAWLEPRVSRETMDRLFAFAQFLVNENGRQNLISSATVPTLWSRHIVDSAQLLDLAPEGNWADLGSGPGFPGLIVAAIGCRPVTLIENRTLRVDFLTAAAGVLGISTLVTIAPLRVEQVRVDRPFAVISARAFAPLPRLLTVARHLADRNTRWLLPKGRSADAELATIGKTWQGDFEAVASITDPQSRIIVASNVTPKGSGR